MTQALYAHMNNKTIKKKKSKNKVTNKQTNKQKEWHIFHLFESPLILSLFYRFCHADHVHILYDTIFVLLLMVL
jgi:hypothetical protein